MSTLFQNYGGSSWMNIIHDSISKTFKSPSKYIRMLSITSSIFMSWTVCRWCYLHLKSKLFNYPPGCYGFPIIGSIPFMSDMCHWNMKMGKRSPISMMKIGSEYIVYLNDMDLIKHKSNLFKESVNRNVINLFEDGENQFFLQSGASWFRRRRIAQNSFLKQLNSSTLNDGYTKYLHDHLFPKMDQYNNKLYTTLMEDFRYAVFRMLFSTSFGGRVAVPAQDSKMLQRFFDLNATFTDTFVLAIFVGYRFGVNIGNFLNFKVFKLLNDYQKNDAFIADWIQQYEENVDSIEDKGFYMDAMLEQIRKNTITRTQLLRDTYSVFGAGVENTSTALEAGVYLLTKHQDIQQRIYAEIQAYKVKHGQVSLQHITELPVLRAFVFEVLRNIETTPHSFPRYMNESDIVLGGYNLPKGCHLMANHYYVNHCEKYWEKPNQFWIEHFLDENNKFVMNRNMITFGVGQRDCMGQTLALKNLNLLFAHIIARYKLVPNRESEFDAPFLSKLKSTWFGVGTIPIKLQLRE